MLLLQIVVLVPPHIEELNKANSLFGQTPGQKAIVGKRPCAWLTAIQLVDRCGLVRDVHQVGNARLHAVSQFVLGNPRVNFGITIVSL